MSKEMQEYQMIVKQISVMPPRRTTILQHLFVVCFGDAFSFHIINVVSEIQYFYIYSAVLIPCPYILQGYIHNVSTCCLQFRAPPLVYQSERHQKMCNWSSCCGKEEAESFSHNWEGYRWCGCGRTSSCRSVLCVQWWLDQETDKGHCWGSRKIFQVGRASALCFIVIIVLIIFIYLLTIFGI